MFETVWTFFQGNAFLTGGFVLGALGCLVAYLRKLPTEIWAWMKRRIIIEIDIPDRDETFQWLDLWLTKQRYQKRCRLLTVRSSRKRDDGLPHSSENCGSYKEDRIRPEILLSPAPGTHYFFYRKRLVILHRERTDGSDNKGGAITFSFRETFNMKVFSRNRKLILDLLEEARELAHPVADERVSVYVPYYGDWTRASKRLPRPIESVIMEGDLAERLLADVKEFQAGEAWYNEHGIPYRRGYLLHGAPGNGKSSIVMALASALHLDICVLNLNSAGLSDDRLNELITNLPPAILLIEDIDCVFQKREKSEKDTITFSGLLNAIDGVMAGEGRILFMTTNYIDQLDPALIRPGRCDLQVEIDNATQDQARRLFLRFFPSFGVEATKFAEAIKPGTISMATIQGHLLKNRNSAESALTSLESMIG